jgi:RND family efflux transporter MFP subunit
MKGALLRWLLPILAVAGTGYAIYYSLVLSRNAPPAPAQLSSAPTSRFPATVSGSGLIEASSRNIDVGSFLPGVVAEVPITEGDWVRKGETLFVLDQRSALADVAVAQRDLAAAQSRIKELEAELADRLDQWRRVERLKIGEVITEERRNRLFYATKIAEAQLTSAKSAVEVARARLASAQVTLDRLTVRAPIEGRVLKVNVQPGQFVVAGQTDVPHVLLGNDKTLHVRVQIDENDLWRFRAGATAEAVLRGNATIRFPLVFLRVEPYVSAKRSLTGDPQERIDTRVLDVIYRFDPAGLPVYVGQQVDVFIDAPPGGS